MSLNGEMEPQHNKLKQNIQHYSDYVGEQTLNMNSC